LVIGAIIFFSLHAMLRRVLRSRLPALTPGQIHTISTKIVSGLQAGCATLLSIRTLYLVEDIIYDKDPVLRGYIWLFSSYFGYDVIIMYKGYHLRASEKMPEKVLGHARTIVAFIRDNVTIVVHHLLFFSLATPFTLLYRARFGDFFVAAFCFAEVSTPFYSIRAILSEMGIKRGLIFALNGILFTVTFFIGRVLNMPYIFYRYAKFKNISVFNVPFAIHTKCLFWSSLFFLLQLWWFGKICRGFLKHLNKILNPPDSAEKTKRKLSTSENISAKKETPVRKQTPVSERPANDDVIGSMINEIAHPVVNGLSKRTHVYANGHC